MKTDYNKIEMFLYLFVYYFLTDVINNNYAVSSSLNFVMSSSIFWGDSSFLNAIT